MATYSGTLLDDAQQVIDAHVATGIDGRCRACGDLDPCEPREEAAVLFRLYERYPQRKPMNALPQNLTGFRGSLFDLPRRGDPDAAAVG